MPITICIRVKKYFSFNVDNFNVSSDNLHCCKCASSDWHRSNNPSLYIGVKVSLKSLDYNFIFTVFVGMYFLSS